MSSTLRLFLIVALAWTASAQTKLLRYPDIHEDKVVFTYAGDLWTASTSGGNARRLTAHPGLELFAKFSPDGQSIAFTGQYDGDEQIYVIPAEGGVPKQLTYYPARGPLAPRWGYDNQVHGWSVDGKSVLFRSTREYWGQKDGRLYTVPVTGGLPTALPMPVSGAGVFSPDGKAVAYSPLFRDFRAWKRYEGGWAQDLYIFYLATNETKQITDHKRSDRDPMWIGDAVFYASDRDGKLNIYRYDIDSGKTSQVTREKTWDVRWPSADSKGQIVYELNGELQVMDGNSGRSRKVSINVPDDGLYKRPSRVSAADLIEDFELSPKGERALFAARGDIFTAPIEKGATRNLTNSSDAHDKWPRWSPDGRQISYVSDATGEDEIYLINQDGSGEPEQLTSNGDVMRYTPEWSPDGKRLAFGDKNGKLYVLTIEDRQMVEIADDTRTQIRQYAWSPNGGHLAFAMTTGDNIHSVFIWSAADGQTRQITGAMFDEWNPAWDPSGDYLYYLSDREFAPQLSRVEWNFATNRQTGIFAVALRKDVKHPFPPESDEVKTEDKDKKNDNGEEKDKDKEKKDGEEKDREPVKIDFDGMAERVAAVPVPADNYGGLSTRKGHLIYTTRPAAYYGRGAGDKPSLKIFDIEKRKAETLAEDVSNYALSPDGSKVLVRHSGGFARYDAKADAKGSKKDVSTKGLMVDRIPEQEWRQIFDEVWRRYRDFFYAANMHGYDWKALREQYLPWLDHVAHRSDLNHVIGEMIAELNVGHAYISGGDYEIPERAKVALPGAEFELDEASGRYRIRKILQGQNEEAIYRAPLTEVGVDANEGDYVLAIDGEDLRAGDNPYRMLRHKAGRPVRLTLNNTPSNDGSREVSYKPITDESNLRYFNWVSNNRRRVTEMTKGEVGYLHIPDMSADGIREFIKWYYPQLRKSGLIIDVRGNGGGNVSAMIIERLRREVLGMWFARNRDDAYSYPTAAVHAHMVCLLSENSASDGDIFPTRFREAGLGPLIGKRSWGGVVGITNRGPLIDGGTVNVPEFATASAEGEYIVEGYGVEPDIVVENDPASEIAGRDPQLERGVQEVLRMMRENPKRYPSRPADPVKTK